MTTDRDGSPAGPTLYLEAGSLDPTDAFCSEVFDDAAAGDYRVVQLTSMRSFDSIQDALDVQLEEVNDPSEAAVILLTPQDEEESTVSRVGEDTPLYGFRVDPQDLTGISVAFSRLIDRWEPMGGTVKICLRNLESLFPYHDTDLVYRFLNTVLATLQGAGAQVHAHVQPSLLDDRALHLTQSLFATVVDQTTDTPTVDEHPPSAESAPAASEESDTAGSAEGAESTVPAGGSDAGGAAPDLEDVAESGSVELSQSEIDDYLADAGFGVLAFDGSPPYAVPMSFGYDPDDRRCYLQLGSFEGSEKQARIEASRSVSLVVTEYARPDRWRSVVVDGTLTPLSETDVDEADAAAVFADGKLASVDVFARDPDEVSFEWYVIDPAATSGRWSVGSP